MGGSPVVHRVAGWYAGKPLRLIAPLINTKLSPKPPIIKGCWLRPDDRNTIVMSDALMKMFGIDAVIGSKIFLDINGRKTAWQLVGITQEFLTSNAYVLMSWIEPENWVSCVPSALPLSTFCKLIFLKVHLLVH